MERERESSLPVDKEGRDGWEAVIVHRNCVLLSYMSRLTEMFPVPQKWLCVKFMSPATTKRTYVFMQTARYFCPIVFKLGVHPAQNFTDIRPVGPALMQTETKGRSLQICERTYNGS